MRCNVEPYEGSQPYVFVSYCHKDKTRVYPYIEMMARRGYRVWYDEGITPGDEWTENIANHLERCGVFVAFVTENSLNSHNCRREINFAVLKDKNVVSLFLDDVKLSAGMEMLLSERQGIFRSKYELAEEFIEKLASTEGLDSCRGEAREDIRVEERIGAEDETMTLTQNVNDIDSSRTETFLLYVALQEKVYIDKSNFGIGRSHVHSDYVIPGEPSISRRHMTLRKYGDRFTITDNRSVNHVGINGKLIAPDVEYDLSSYDLITFATEHMVMFKDYDESFLKTAPELLIRDNVETWTVDRKPVIRIGSRPIDRHGKGNEICLRGMGIKDFHALIIRTIRGSYIVDISGTGQTRLGSVPLRYGEKELLKPGSVLAVGNRKFEVTSRV